MSRNRYTPTENNAILDFVEKNKDMLKAGGNKLWKKEENERVTLQSWQSMKSRFQLLAPGNLGPKTTPKRRKIDATQATLPFGTGSSPGTCTSSTTATATATATHTITSKITFRDIGSQTMVTLIDSSLPSFHKRSHPQTATSTCNHQNNWSQTVIHYTNSVSTQTYTYVTTASSHSLNSHSIWVSGVVNR